MTQLRLSALPPDVLAASRDRLTAVQDRIHVAATQAGRATSEITLVGVAKKQPLERVLGAIAAGVDRLGQSYVQEARTVLPEIAAALASDSSSIGAGLRWHMVGRLQRNKTGLAARLFDVVESVDRPELADRLARHAGSEGRPLDVYLQVSLCRESQKGGCAPDDLHTLARLVLAQPSLRLAGLMTVPASNLEPEASRPAFRRLRELRDGLVELDAGLANCGLSMGMSRDFEVAIQEGATLVRVGTALFGERLPSAEPSGSKTA